MAVEVQRSMEALVGSQQTFAATLANIHDGVLVADADGRLVYLNPTAERTLGIGTLGQSREEWTAHQGIYLADASTQILPHERPLARALGGEDVRDVELFIRNAALPEGRYINVNAGPLRDDAGASHGAWVSFRDMSLKRRFDEQRVHAVELERRGQQAVEASRLKSEFLANMSHELRTPLNAIIGFTDLMHRGKAGTLSELQEEYLGDVLASSRHLLQLINDVLDLSKVESGKMDFRPEPIELRKVVEEVSDVLGGVAAGKHLLVETHVDPRVAAVVVDPGRVKQILYNYLSNAIKFTPDGGRAHVRIVPDGRDCFRIDVTDTGIGISPTDIEKLFVEFRQLDTTASKQYQGTGLGLALTKRLVEAQGGHVTVQSTVNVGSVFSATLPRIMTTVNVVHAATPIATSRPGLRTILIVDDDPNTVKLADARLREAGYCPVCSDNAEHALLLAQNDPPAVVVVDLLMPGTDGFEFIARLRTTPAGRQVPIVVWTVKDLDTDERHWLQASAAAIVTKTAGGADALLAELHRLLPLPTTSLGSRGNHDA
jgi:signal transduction histidine kinase